MPVTDLLSHSPLSGYKMSSQSLHNFSEQSRPSLSNQNIHLEACGS